MSYQVEFVDVQDNTLASIILDDINFNVGHKVNLKIQNNNTEFFSTEEFESKNLRFEVLDIEHNIDIMYTPKPSTVKMFAVIVTVIPI